MLRSRPRRSEATRLLCPLLRAYSLGYASAVAPRLLTLLLQHFTHRRAPDRPFWPAVARILRSGLDWWRFPTFCATLVGGSTLLVIPLRRGADRYASTLSAESRLRLSRWLSSFISAWLSLTLLQSKTASGFADAPVPKPEGSSLVDCKPLRRGGRTLDLTLFAATRAFDVIIGEIWRRWRSRRTAGRRWTKGDLASRFADPSVFAASCALIMWTWIFLPSRLPRSYDKWISSAASVDARLIEALQRCRRGELRYGEETGQAALLQSMCQDFGWPLDWGDPVKAIPFPCEMVHMGCGPSCEYHAIHRFYRSWRWSMMTYLPLNLVLVARNPSFKRLMRSVISASRSSAFLGAFIALFYYGVCLARTRLGPRLLGRDRAACQIIDGGICVGTGCLLCGWSIMLEQQSRWKELALFVAPRALATLFPRRYPLEKQWRETVVFAASTAVVFTCILEDKKLVRGVFGNVLATVLDA